MRAEVGKVEDLQCHFKEPGFALLGLERLVSGEPGLS